MVRGAILRMHTLLMFVYLVLISSLVLANPYQKALENVRCKLNSYKISIEQPNCEKREIWLNTCVGVCIGSSAPAKTSPYNMQSTCDACKMHEYADVFVELYCKGNTGTFTKFYKVRGAKSCHCARCS